MYPKLVQIKIRRTKHALAGRWMRFLQENKAALTLTLEDERIHIESVFTEKRGSDLFLYWYNLRSPGGKSVHESANPLDRKHLEFARKCVEPGSKRELVPVVDFVPKSIAIAVRDRQELLKKRR